MGVPPTQILASQMNHLSYAATGPGGLKGAFGEAVGALRSFISPATLVVGGAAAMAGAAYLAYSSWKNFALALDDVSKQAGTTTDTMAKLQAAASFKGIDSGEFTKGISGFSRSVYEARNNMGGLVEVLRVNGVSAAGDFSTMLGKAADIIQKAGNDQQRLVLLQQMGLPATMEWVRFMQQGADGIKRAKSEAVEFGGAANDNLIAKAREADEAWNQFWTNFGLRARGAVVSAATWLNTLDLDRRATRLITWDNPDANRWVGKNLLKAGQGTQLSQSGADEFYKAMPGAGSAFTTAAKKTVDKDAVQRDIAIRQPRLGLLGTLPTAAQQTAKANDEKTAPKPEPQREAA